MALKEYKELVEKKFGPICLPNDSGEISKVISSLTDELERPTWEDYYLLQAIEIISDWQDKNDHFRKKNLSDDEGYRRGPEL